MHTQSKELRVDRIEEGIAIAFDENGAKYIFSQNDFPACEGDIAHATFDRNGRITEIKIFKKKTNEEKELLQSRLSNLFKTRGAKK